MLRSPRQGVCHRIYYNCADVFHYIAVSLPLSDHQSVPYVQLGHISYYTSLCEADECDDRLRMKYSSTIRTIHKHTISFQQAYHYLATSLPRASTVSRSTIGCLSHPRQMYPSMRCEKDLRQSHTHCDQQSNVLKTKRRSRY